MKYAIDASVGFKWLIDEQWSDKARMLRDDFRNRIHELIAPDIFPVEVTHGLTRAERQSRIATAEGGILFAELVTCLPQQFPSLSILGRAYEMSSQHRIGVYDCLYVALAEREKTELVTADDKLLKTLQNAFPFVKHLSTLP